MNKEIDIPVGKKFMLTVKPLDMDGAVEIIRVECVEDEDQSHCSECAFQHKKECHIYECFSVYRRDGKSVYFKRIEVFGEELNLNNKIMSRKFDLNAAINGAKIQTRNGYPARIICNNAVSLYPVIALVMQERGEELLTYTREGKRFGHTIISNYDLVMVPERRYINVYRDPKGNYHCSKQPYPTEDVAKDMRAKEVAKFKKTRCVGTIEVEQ
jgi:hypothetical protein